MHRELQLRAPSLQPSLSSWPRAKSALGLRKDIRRLCCGSSVAACSSLLLRCAAVLSPPRSAGYPGVNTSEGSPAWATSQHVIISRQGLHPACLQGFQDEMICSMPAPWLPAPAAAPAAAA
jgi:hypothetical protein